MTTKASIWAIGLLLISCSGKTEIDGGDNGEFDDIVGDYRWFGSRLGFWRSPSRPPLSELAPISSPTDLVARLYEENRQLYLSTPFCARIPLKRDKSLLTAEQVTCPLTTLDQQLETTGRTLPVLRINLANKTVHAYQEVTLSRSGLIEYEHTVSTGSFVRQIGTKGSGGSPNANETLVSEAGAKKISKFTGDGTDVFCEVPSDEDCADTGYGHHDTGVKGAVSLLPNGRYYIYGYDCSVAQDYKGPPLQCGSALKGFPRGDIPEVWLTRFSLQNNQLSFDAELRLHGTQLYALVRTPLRDL